MASKTGWASTSGPDKIQEKSSPAEKLRKQKGFFSSHFYIGVNVHVNTSEAIHLLPLLVFLAFSLAGRP